MAGLEAAAAGEFLYSALHGDATLMTLVGDIWEDEPPQGATYPLIVYQFMSGIDLMVIGANRVWSNMIWLVKAVGQTANYGDLNAVVARIDTLLHRGSGVVADGTIWVCIREQTVRLPEDVLGKPYRSVGAQYRINAI